jgi:hypothetical protein
MNTKQDSVKTWLAARCRLRITPIAQTCSCWPCRVAACPLRMKLPAHSARPWTSLPCASWASRATGAGDVDAVEALAEKYGHDAVLVGFTTHHGTVTAASDWGKPAERKRVRPAVAGSYEALFHAAQRVRFLLVWNEGDTVAERLRARQLERAIGVIPSARATTSRRVCRTVLQFDETRAIKPLENTTEWEAGELPETFPFAV